MACLYPKRVSSYTQGFHCSLLSSFLPSLLPFPSLPPSLSSLPPLFPSPSLPLPQNCLIQKEPNGVFRTVVADFGLAARIKQAW